MKIRVRFRVLGAVLGGALLAGVGVGVSGGLVTTSSIPKPVPAVAVSPHTKLVDLQSVLVVASHFSPQVTVGTVECMSKAVDIDSCDLSTLVYAQTNSVGAVTLHRPVRRILDITGTSVDCAVGKGCILGVGNVSDFTESAGAAILFDPAVPPIPTKITGSPAVGLRDHQLITVHGQGFNPGTSVGVVECTAASTFDCAYETSRNAEVGNDGTFSIPNFAVEREFVSFDETGADTVDCATSPHTCVLETQIGSFGDTVEGSLSFNKAIPPAVAAISVAPSTKLTDLQMVTVDGFGFLPGAQVQVVECATSTFACDPGALTVTAGFQGQFTVTMAVHRRLAGAGAGGVVATDCASHLGACAIVAEAPGSLNAPNVSLVFDPKKKPAVQSISAHPTSGLTDNEKISVSLKGFAPYRPVAVVECSADAVAHQDLSYCDTSTELVTTSPAGGGHPSATLFARRQIVGENGLVDCAAKAGACVLIATPYEFFGYGGVGGGSGGGIAVGGGLTASKAAPNGAVRPNVKSRALPAPDLVGHAAQAAKGSSIPGLAIVSLSFHH